jgi:AcrR family transcriptional regulator
MFYSNSVIALVQCSCQVPARRSPSTDDIPAPPWQRRAPARGAARRPPITREAIVEEALALIDRDGVDALSMRRLAEELGTGPASLYWHVGNKDELLDLVFDRVVGEFEIPGPDPARWREQTKDLARQMRAVLLRHRDLVRISLGRFPMGPNGLRLTEGMLAVMRASGLPDRTILPACYLLTIVVNAFALEDANTLRAPGGEDADPEEIVRMMSGYFASLPADRFPNLTAVADDFFAGSMDDRFELLLDVFVGGLEARG